MCCVMFFGSSREALPENRKGFGFCQDSWIMQCSRRNKPCGGTSSCAVVESNEQYVVSTAATLKSLSFWIVIFFMSFDMICCFSSRESSEKFLQRMISSVKSGAFFTSFLICSMAARTADSSCSNFLILVFRLSLCISNSKSRDFSIFKEILARSFSNAAIRLFASAVALAYFFPAPPEFFPLMQRTGAL